MFNNNIGYLILQQRYVYYMFFLKRDYINKLMFFTYKMNYSLDIACSKDLQGKCLVVPTGRLENTNKLSMDLITAYLRPDGWLSLITFQLFSGAARNPGVTVPVCMQSMEEVPKNRPNLIKHRAKSRPLSFSSREQKRLECTICFSIFLVPF